MKYNLDNISKTLNITIPSDIINTNTEQIRKELINLLDSPLIKQAVWDLLKLDLTAAKIVDSAGLNLVVSVIKTASVRGAKVAVKISNAKVQSTFMTTRLDKQMTVEMVS